MTEVHFSIKLVRGLWEVRAGGRRDLDLTDAVRKAIGEKSLETQRKAARFLGRFFNFRLRSNESPDVFVDELFQIGRIRIEAFLDSEGYDVVYDTDRIDGSCYVRRPKGSVSSLPVGLAALARLYFALGRAGLRSRANPARVDNWHKLEFLDRVELATAVVGSKADPRAYKGSQYIASGLAPSPLRIEDPSGLAEATLAAGRAAGWPAAIYDLVTVMGNDGSRWADTASLTAADWAVSSRFGRTLWAPNKASKGRRVKELVITAECAVQLRNSFDDNPKRPSMAMLEMLLEAGDFGALEKIYLFPSQRGLPYTYGVFNNDYFRPAMEKAGLLIRSPNSAVRPTAHRLRAARIQDEIDHIVVKGRSMEDIEADLAGLQSDVHIKSKAAFKRYAGESLRKLALNEQVRRFDVRQGRIAKGRADGPPQALHDSRPPSRAQARLRNLGK